jgi:hypothetical protein
MSTQGGVLQNFLIGVGFLVIIVYRGLKHEIRRASKKKNKAKNHVFLSQLWPQAHKYEDNDIRNCRAVKYSILLIDISVYSSGNGRVEAEIERGKSV